MRVVIDALLRECLVQQPCYYGEVTALVVGGQKYRVLVLVHLGCHVEGILVRIGERATVV